MDSAMCAALCRAWRTKAADLLRISKAYHCKSQEVLRTAYVKQAAQLSMCANELEAACAEARKPETKGEDDRADEGQATGAVGPVVEEHADWKAPDWPSAAGAERQDQGP